MTALTFDSDGWLQDVRRIASPNFNERPAGVTIELVVLHNISLPPGKFGGTAIIDLFTNQLDIAADPYFETIKDLRVSAHFLIRRDGELIQFVSCDARAWHAGQSEWRGKPACNDYSIGIELEGSDDVPFTAAQYDAVISLAQALQQRYPIQAFVGHSDIAPSRKTDPGPHFDWERFRAGL